MAKNTTINIRVDSEVKAQVEEIFANLGLTFSQAFNLMLHQARIVRGLPFEVKQRLPVELNDGHGSYICAYGHVHDYSKPEMLARIESIENGTAEMLGPFDTFEAYKASLSEGDDDDEV